jgi:type IV pilus assembly protein PilZ
MSQPIELRVEYQRLNTFFADYIRNIATGSLFIRTGTPVPVGADLAFRLSIPGMPHGEIHLAGKVEWTRAPADVLGKPGVEAGMGVRFHFPSEAERLRFHADVEGMLRGSLGDRLYHSLLAAARK